MAKLSKTNPLPEILELIPYKESLLDLRLSDDIRIVLYKHLGFSPKFSNAYIAYLLSHLANNGLVDIQQSVAESVLGDLVFVKRNLLNGTHKS